MVWFQANKFKVPRIAFVNKMDRPGASLEFTLQTIKNKLNVTPLVLQVPVGDSERFSAVIDLLNMELISWSDKLGCIVERSRMTEAHKLYKDALAAKEKLIENISMFDDAIAVELFARILLIFGLGKISEWRRDCSRGHKKSNQNNTDKEPE